jgi:superoxide dismutase, Cu-Zn family
MMGRISRFMLLSFSLGLFAACGTKEVDTGGAVGDTHAPVSAAAVFESKPGALTAGTVKFIQTEGELLIAAVLSGLPPGKHGIHLHEKGVCAEPDYASAGEHFNPTNQPHACPPDKARHAGDLGNVEVDAEGNARFELRTDLLTVDAGPSSVVGRAVILHDMEDDCMTHPSGAAGKRLACAVVQMN